MEETLEPPTITLLCFSRPLWSFLLALFIHSLNLSLSWQTNSTSLQRSISGGSLFLQILLKHLKMRSILPVVIETNDNKGLVCQNQKKESQRNGWKTQAESAELGNFPKCLILILPSHQAPFMRTSVKARFGLPRLELSDWQLVTCRWRTDVPTI